MALKTAYNSRLGWHVSGQSPEFAKYERDIMSGKILPPYGIEFTDSNGNRITGRPIPLTPTGNAKIDLFS